MLTGRGSPSALHSRDPQQQYLSAYRAQVLQLLDVKHRERVMRPSTQPCLCVVVVLVQGWIPTSVINWSLEAIPLNITRVRAAMERLDPDQLALLPESNRQQGAACTKRPAREQLGRLPEGWPASCFAAGHGGPGNSTPGVHDGVQGRALVRGNSSCSVDSNNAPSCGSFGSLRQSEPGGSEGDEGVQWFDALGG